MRYVALLRGINVGGNTIISMAELKESCVKLGLENVATYINSGNVIFESSEKSTTKLAKTLEEMITKKFSLSVRVVVKSKSEMQKILKAAPAEWSERSDIRCYVAFLLDPNIAKTAAKEIPINEKVDQLHAGPGVLYMTTRLDSLTKSKFNKMASMPIYKTMTIRNLNTTRKLLALLETS